MQIFKTIYLTLSLCVFFITAHAQYGCCSFKIGDTIYNENFGIGTFNYIGKRWDTSYSPVTQDIDLFENSGFKASGAIRTEEGSYIRNHTPELSSGNMLVFHGDFNDNYFFRRHINNLEENTYYEFSAWLLNLLPRRQHCADPLPYFVNLEIWSVSTGRLLASSVASSLTEPNTWERFFRTFRTGDRESEVILVIRNHISDYLRNFQFYDDDCKLPRPPIPQDKCGNYLAIDDIVVKSCGGTPSIDTCKEELPCTIQTYITHTDLGVCEATLERSVHVESILAPGRFSQDVLFQWQESSDNNLWTDIHGQTSNTFDIPLVNGRPTQFYRLIKEERSVSALCDVYRPKCPFEIEYFNIISTNTPEPPISGGGLSFCANEAIPTIQVQVPPGLTVNWYRTAEGGRPFSRNTTRLINFEPGTYYAEALYRIGGCVSASRTPVTLALSSSALPEIEDELLRFCEGTSMNLHANVANANSIEVSYLWNTGDTTESITISRGGTYFVAVWHNECQVEKKIIVSQISLPVIKKIESNQRNIVVSLRNDGDFLYAIDGVNYQTNSTFFNVQGGRYTIYVKERHCDTVITQIHLHFYVPNYFTPNGDGSHDTFKLYGLEHFTSYEVTIFNRYGRLIAHAKNEPFEWDGSYNGKPMSTGDYWYTILVDGKKNVGHFTLKY